MYSLILRFNEDEERDDITNEPADDEFAPKIQFLEKDMKTGHDVHMDSSDGIQPLEKKYHIDHLKIPQRNFRNQLRVENSSNLKNDEVHELNIGKTNLPKNGMQDLRDNQDHVEGKGAPPSLPSKGILKPGKIGNSKIEDTKEMQRK